MKKSPETVDISTILGLSIFLVPVRASSIAAVLLAQQILHAAVEGVGKRLCPPKVHAVHMALISLVVLYHPVSESDCLAKLDLGQPCSHA
jgi:hypothetical protein